jgi:hydrogenase-4 component F
VGDRVPDFLPFLLLAIPALAALVCLLASTLEGPEYATLVSALALLVVGTWVTVDASGATLRLSPGLYLDSLTAVLVLVICTLSAVVLVYSLGYMRHEVARGHLTRREVRWYYVWLHLFVWSMLSVVLAANLGIMWVAMETTTVVSGVLVGFTRRPAALEAAWKYVVICSLGIALALFGTVLMYYAAAPVVGLGNTGLDWPTLSHVAAHLNPGLVRLSFIFILIGFGTKAGLAPMHTWLPDAHSQAPSPVSALLSAVLLNCALYVILRYHALALRVLGPDFSSHLLLVFGLLSITVAVPFLLVQHDLKRLLAYSSMEHIGIITAAAGIGGRLGLFAALFHLVAHGLAKCTMFLLSGTMIQRLGSRNIHRLAGIGRTAPAFAAATLLGGLALAGSPPFGTFIGEFTAVQAALAGGDPVAGVLFLVLLVGAFGGLLFQLGGVALARATARPVAPEVLDVATRYDQLGGVAVALPSLALLLLGVHAPSGLVTLFQQAALVVGGR